MLKKHVRRVLLPLLFSCFFVFSGFLSVNAYALSSTYPQYNLTINGVKSYSSGLTYTQGDDVIYSTVVNSPITLEDGLIINLYNDGDETDAYFNFPVMPDVYDYYVYTSYAQRSQVTGGGTFRPTSIVFSNGTGTNTYPNRLTDITAYQTYYASADNAYNLNVYNFVGKLNLVELNGTNYLSAIKFLGTGTLKARQYFQFSVFCVPKGDSFAISNIIESINNQTTTLGGKLDKIDQTIEDQFTGEPGNEFNVDSIISQHTDKMGVLSFGSDVMIQFLDLFQASNVGPAELTLPGFSITVQDVEYQVWEDHTFRFSTLDELVPELISVVRIILILFIWLAVLRYCIKVFEDNFLSK